ncbi:uncharacterized protein LOC141605466 isoform X2 [Silene latifolia]
MSMGEPYVFTIQSMKDRGNSLFKKGNVSLAGSLYKQALIFLCFVGFLPPHDQHATFSLALSLILNLAACELKLSHYELASRYCKFILHFDPCNVKALYRRGLAYKQHNLLKDALVDFEHVLHLDPNNSEASREILAVVNRLVVNPNGKRVAFPFDPLSSLNRGKKPLLTADVADKPVVTCSCSGCTKPMNIEINSGPASMVLDTTCEANTPLVVEGSLSYMRVRPLTPKNSIQTGTPHEKKRVLSESTQVSKISTVQFQFVAVRDNKNKICGRRADCSHRRSRVTHDSIYMKKRSSVSVDFLFLFAATPRTLQR